MSITPLDMQVSFQSVPMLNENKLNETHRNTMQEMASATVVHKEAEKEQQRTVRLEKKEDTDYKYDAKDKSNQEYQEQKNKKKQTLAKQSEEEVIRSIKKIDIKI